jgi:import inner membrane translocase subunit TIM54
VHDRREKKRLQAQWCAAVAHLAREPLAADAMPRRLRVVLAPTPGDGLLAAREHFYEYARPVLMAAGVDWEAVEGRGEGDVRVAIAEAVRARRARSGEGAVDEMEDQEKRQVVREWRASHGVREDEETAGDIVIGRNTWKEYVRGLHEGWLGPLKNPAAVVEVQDSGVADTDAKASSDVPMMGDEPTPASTGASTATEGAITPLDIQTVHSTDEQPQAKSEPEPPPPETEKKKDEKKPRPPPFIDTKSYSEASLPPSLPNILGPSVAVPYPVIFGFLNTPVRMWRFLNQRRIADDVGRQVAAAILASHAQYQQVERPSSDVDSSPTAGSAGQPTLAWEQVDLLQDEEWGWVKSVRKRVATEPGKDSTWTDPVVMDSRIASRMAKFVLPVDQKFEGEVSFSE